MKAKVRFILHPSSFILILMALPLIARVRRSFRQPAVADVAVATEEAISKSRLAARLPAGGRIAVTAGSRGISEIGPIVRATVQALRTRGFDPFVVSAMGSHGGGSNPRVRSACTVAR